MAGAIAGVNAFGLFLFAFGTRICEDALSNAALRQEQKSASGEGSSREDQPFATSASREPLVGLGCDATSDEADQLWALF